MNRGFKVLSDNQITINSFNSEKQQQMNSDLFAVSNPQFAPKIVFRDSRPELNAFSISRYGGKRFDPFDYTTIRDNAINLDEFSLYYQYRESYMSNPYTVMVIEGLLERILGDGFHFEGSGASRVESFFEEDGTYKKIEELVRDVLIFGNGFMDFGLKARANKYVNTRILDPESIMIDLETDPKKPDYGMKTYMQSGEKLRTELLFHLTIRNITGYPYGISLLRPNLYFLQLLLDCGGDVGAALKRMSYAPLDIALDLDGIPNQETKDEIIEKHENKFKTFNSATNNIIHDKRHTVQLVGTGSSGGRLLPTNDMLEPIISVVLRNFGVPIGVFLQQGANKAIVMEQREDARPFFEKIRRSLKYDIERNIISRIAKSNCSLVWNKPPPSTMDTQAEMQTMMTAYNVGLIPREQFLDMFDIPIKDGTFVQTDGNMDRSTSKTLTPKNSIDRPNYESGEQ